MLFATSFHLMIDQIFTFINERGHSFAEYQEAKRKKIEADKLVKILFLIKMSSRHESEFHIK